MSERRFDADDDARVVQDNAPAGWHGRLSLRFKGVISLFVVVAYVGIVAVLVTSEREHLLNIVQDLEQIHRQEEELVQVRMLLARAIMTANESYYAPQTEMAAKQLLLETAPLENLLATVSLRYPETRQSFHRLQRIAREIAEQPTRGVLAELRAELHRIVVQFDALANALRIRKEKILSTYQVTHDKVTLQTLSFVFLGIVVFGAVVTIFFTRLTWDIRRAAARAMAVVKGYRGRPLEVTRGDEIGGLMEAINRMQRELRERETRLEMSRQQQLHKEKMAAVGSLASTIAHEINNPIMAIAGVAQAIAERCPKGSDNPVCSADCHPELILEHTRRIAQITRQIAEFSLPQSAEPQLVDMNGLIRNTCNFIRFDKRFQRIDIKLDLDNQLPAAFAVADHLTQVMINVLVNAADALEAVVGRRPEVRVMTRRRGERLEIAVVDNGEGMDSETLKQACDEFFTTKSRGKGSGLGLFLCKTLVEQDHGELSIQSEPGVGTQVIISFPADQEYNEER